MTKELLFPFYCFYCGNLAFVFKREDADQLQIIEYNRPDWKPHACFTVFRQQFGDNEHIQLLQSLPWGEHRMPFAHRRIAGDRKQRKFTQGVVTEIISLPDKENRFEVLTVENHVFEIKPASNDIPKTVGLLIDLSDLKRVGKGRYKINVINQLPMQDYVEDTLLTSNEIYYIDISSKDQEQLETFIDRLLKVFLSLKLNPLCIIPQKITRSNKLQQFHRRITIPPDSSFLDAINKMNIPDNILMSIKQLSVQNNAIAD